MQNEHGGEDQQPDTGRPWSASGSEHGSDAAAVSSAGSGAAPGTGTVDFAALKPFVKPEHIKVFEFSNKIPVEAVKRGIAHLKLIWGNE